jgi:hypothetical protein
VLAATLAGVSFLVACSPHTQGAERQLLDSLQAGGGRQEVALSEALDASPWDELRIVCPYAEPLAVAVDLDLDIAAVPDLSTTEDQQAVVLVDGDGSESWVFSRSRVDLCSRGDWPVMRPGDGDRITFEFDDARGAWVAVS